MRRKKEEIEQLEERFKASVEKYEVSPLELIFDLVFIVALSELSAHLLTDLSWRGLAEMIVLLIAVYNVWSYTSFEATLIHVGKAQTQWMMLIVMLLGLFMTAYINHAFREDVWIFVIPFLVCQIGHGILTTFSPTTKVLRAHYSIMLGWILASAPLWIAGALVNPKDRLIWWGLAAGVDIVGTWFAHPVPGRVLRSDNIEFDAGHMIERCRLLLIIALGEMVITTATAISEVPISFMTLITGICSFVSIISLWALYFGGSDHLVVSHAEETTNPILAARLAMNVGIVAVAGIILFAVGIHLSITEHIAKKSLSTGILLFGGSILYLISQGWYLWRITKRVPYYRIAGASCLLIAGVLSFYSKAYINLLIVSIILAILAGITVGFVKRKGAYKL